MTAQVENLICICVLVSAVSNSTSETCTSLPRPTHSNVSLQQISLLHLPYFCMQMVRSNGLLGILLEEKMGWGELQHRLESTQTTRSIRSPFPGHSLQKSSTYPPPVMSEYQDCGFSKWIRSQRVL